MKKYEDVFGAAVAGTILLIILDLFLALLTQFAWSYSVGEIFHLPNISFLQALCLNLLGYTIFHRGSK